MKPAPAEEANGEAEARKRNLRRWMLTGVAIVMLTGCRSSMTLSSAQNGISSASSHCFTRLSFSPDDRRLAAGSTDVGWISENCSVVVFDLESGKEIQRVRPPESWGRCRLIDVAYYPTRGLLLACYRPKTRGILVWPVDEPEPLIELGCAAKDYRGRARFAPGGQQICLAGTGTNDGLWDLDLLQRRFPLSAKSASGMAFSEDGRWIAIGSREQKRGEDERQLLELWDARSGRQVWERDVNWDVEVMAVSSANRSVLSVEDRTRIRDLASGLPIQAILSPKPSAGETTAAAFLAVASLVGGELAFGGLLESWEPKAMGVSSDGKNWVMAGSMANLDTMLNPNYSGSAVTVIDAKSAKPVINMSTPRHSRAGERGMLTFSPDGRWIALADNGLFVFEVRTGALWIGQPTF